MLRSILVALDGSTYSATAVQLAAQWAKRSNALVGGIGVIDEPTICAGEAFRVGGIAFEQFMKESRLADARMKVNRWLKSFEETCECASLAHRETEAIGLPFEQIVLEAQRYDIMLLGQHTFFHFET